MALSPLKPGTEVVERQAGRRTSGLGAPRPLLAGAASSGCAAGPPTPAHPRGAGCRPPEKRGPAASLPPLRRATAASRLLLSRRHRAPAEVDVAVLVLVEFHPLFFIIFKLNSSCGSWGLLVPGQPQTFGGSWWFRSAPAARGPCTALRGPEACLAAVRLAKERLQTAPGRAPRPAWPRGEA